MDIGIGTSQKEHPPHKEWQESVLIRERGAPQREASDAKFSIKYYDICSTGISILMRAITVIINIKLALSYYQQGSIDYFIWTTACIVIPMIITTLIHANMCFQDEDLNKGSYKVTWITFLSSFLFRYWNSLCYSISCKKAERRGDLEAQKKFYKLTIREESDVAFIRIFECFLEAAPQKILQISIVLSLTEEMSYIQIVAICSYFGSMAWCLSAYHRCNRSAQIDKYNIKTNGFIMQLCWHFCVSVSRTLCISFAASLFPLWTLLGCVVHSMAYGLLTFLIDRPKFCTLSIGNFLFCMILGVVYLFTYIMPKDGRTRNKYIVYYILNSIENVACVLLFIMYSSEDMRSAMLFYPMCVLAIAFYYIGICYMILYYMCFHPKITARSSKLMLNHK